MQIVEPRLWLCFKKLSLILNFAATCLNNLFQLCVLSKRPKDSKIMILYAFVQI